MIKNEESESVRFKIGDKIMGLGKIPEYGGYTIVSGDIVGVEYESYIVKSELYNSCQIKKELALVFNDDAWNRAIKHWYAFWELGYSEEEEDKIQEDVKQEIDKKTNMEFLRAMRALNGFNDEDLGDDELVHKVTKDGEIWLPRLVVIVKNGVATWRDMS